MTVPTSIFTIFSILIFIAPGMVYRRSRKRWKSHMVESRHEEWFSIVVSSIIFSGLALLMIRLLYASDFQKIYAFIAIPTENTSLEGMFYPLWKIIFLACLIGYLYSNLLCLIKRPAFVNATTIEKFFDNAPIEALNAYPLMARCLAKSLNRLPKSSDYSMSILRMRNGDTLIGIPILYSQEESMAEKDLLLIPIPEKWISYLPTELQNIDLRLWQRQYVLVSAISSIQNVYFDKQIEKDLIQATESADKFTSEISRLN